MYPDTIRVVSDVTDLPEQAKNMHHLPVLLIFLHFRGWDVFIKQIYYTAMLISNVNQKTKS